MPPDLPTRTIKNTIPARMAKQNTAPIISSVVLASTSSPSWTVKSLFDGSVTTGGVSQSAGYW